MAKNKSKISSSVKIIFFGLIVTVTYFFAQSLLMPKYVTDIKEGTLIAEFYSEKDKNFDVFFIGDCEVYENFSPVKLWTEYGINSYIRGSAKQTVLHIGGYAEVYKTQTCGVQRTFSYLQ